MTQSPPSGLAFEYHHLTLASVTRLEHCPVHQKVSGLIPGRDTPRYISVNVSLPSPLLPFL